MCSRHMLHKGCQFFLLCCPNIVIYNQTQEHFQPRVHGFEIGMKLEVVHPMKPSIICPATVTKSLGPYYFSITTDYQEDVPSMTFCCHSDSPGIFPAGWCSRHQVELAVPASKCNVQIQPLNSTLTLLLPESINSWRHVMYF